MYDSKLADEVELFGGRKGPRAFALIALKNDWSDHHIPAGNVPPPPWNTAADAEPKKQQPRLRGDSSRATSLVDRRSELVAQGELHDSRLSQQTRVGAELRRRLLDRRYGRSHALGIEANLVEHVEHAPGELDVLGVADSSVLDQAQVQFSVALSSQHVARRATGRIRNGELRLCPAGSANIVTEPLGCLYTPVWGFAPTS